MRIIPTLFSLVFTLGLVACSNDNNNNDFVTPPLDEGDARGGELANQVSADLAGTSDAARISYAAGVVLEINAAEIDKGNLALTRCRATDVCNFASAMVDDHTANTNDLNALLASLQIASADSRVAAAVTADADADIAFLQTSNDFDFDYLQVSVKEHQTAIVLLDELIAQVAQPTFHAFLVDTQNAISAHLSDAEALLRTF